MTPRAQAGNPSRLSQPHPPHTYVIAGTLASVSLSSVGMTKTPLSASRRLFGRRRRGRRDPLDTLVLEHLTDGELPVVLARVQADPPGVGQAPVLAGQRVAGDRGLEDDPADHLAGRGHLDRSEEHTSELQSPTNLVCRLL